MYCNITQTVRAVPAAMLVTKKAIVARASDASSDPALKPNHPNQSNPAPNKTKGTLCGSIPELIFLLGPRSHAAATAAIPALI